MDNWTDLKILQKFNHGDIKYPLFTCHSDDQKVHQENVLLFS